MRELTCIVCPIGCPLDVEDNGDSLTVTGNKCPRGEKYVLEEIRAPKRIVTATAAIRTEPDTILPVRRVPVKTSSPCPKEKINALLNDIYKLEVSLPVKTGDIIIAGWKPCNNDQIQCESIDIVATRSVE